MSSQNPGPFGDLTPESAAPTDVAPLGRQGPKPEHEKTAAEDADLAPWDRIAADPDFKELLSRKGRFIIKATVFFVIYYFALLVLVGWFPDVMKKKVFGEVNWAYLFALSQFFMAWALAFIYVGAATGWDKTAAALIAKFTKR
jgi:uncharacterized membrane protein (DUF485 family)